MSLFLALLAVCLAGGFLVTSLIWLLFWLVGVFEVPEGIRNRFGTRHTVRRYQWFGLRNAELNAQTARAAWARAFKQAEDSDRLLRDGNSAPQRLLRAEISSDKSNSASSHALATN